MSLTLITAPVGAAISLSDAKLHLRIDSGNAEDLLLQSMIDAATQEAEHLLQAGILAQTWRLSLDEFPGAYRGCSNLIRIPMGNISAISQVRYVVADTGVLTTLSGSEYLADVTDPLHARVSPAYGKAWPAARLQMAAVQVDFVTGWANAGAVPEVVKAWLRLRVGALYEFREAWTLGKSIERNPHMDGLLDRYRRITL